MVTASSTGEAAALSFDTTPAGALVVRMSGPWQLGGTVPSAAEVEEKVASGGLKRVEYDASALTKWDSSVLTFVTRLAEICKQRGINEDRAGLPNGVRRLLDLAEAVPERKGARAEEQDESAPRAHRQGDAFLDPVESRKSCASSAR